MNKKKDNNLLDANTAVESYLDNLLQEATEPSNEKPTQYAEPNHNIHVLETPLTIAKQDVTPEDVPILIAETEETDVLVDIEEGINSDAELNKRDIKELFNFPIQCLMFKVNNNLLSIPLINMGSVVPFKGHLTQLPYSPDYFKGLLKYREHNVRVADTAVLLNSSNGSEFSPSHLLVFEEEDWAISCDVLLDVVTLTEDDIKWHEEGSDRISLGTIKQSLALILNPEAITKKLIDQ